MRLRVLYLLLALISIGGLSTSCSIDDDNVLPVQATGDEIDDHAEPDEDDD